MLYFNAQLIYLLLENVLAAVIHPPSHFCGGPTPPHLLPFTSASMCNALLCVTHIHVNAGPTSSRTCPHTDACPWPLSTCLLTTSPQGMMCGVKATHLRVCYKPSLPTQPTSRPHTSHHSPQCKPLHTLLPPPLTHSILLLFLFLLHGSGFA